MLITPDTNACSLYSKIICRTAHKWGNIYEHTENSSKKWACMLKEQGKDKNIAVLL